ncbi:hypothetical protein C2E21_5875 isoform A [Chlorella sorokiniana]|uniref:Uncharacterized protein n=1 Tax=Chlorella sorokiniana TaxID=3076 RepID=A0A2P6TMB8_CHLSO|nr:hypothetical protein C2E21_5875 isoform A [Chlorella sorokiniana]|eukprot:PRW45468.1 hypothetical protein C2E21_5875 isoform A [Chlorella sorokiniana]
MFQHQLLPHEKWPRQQAGAGEAQLSLPQPPPGREELPASQNQPSELLADALLWEQLAQEEWMAAEAAHSRHSAAAALGYSATAAHDPLDTLREAAWQAAKDKAQAKEAVLVAFAHATSQLPGSRPQLLGVAPAVFVLLLGNPERARPAGVLLVQVPTAYGAPRSSSDGSGSRQRWSEAHAEEHVLRVLVYCPKTGTLLEHRDWLLKEEHQLADHPLFGLPCWDSRDGWQLLFPDPLDEPHQATMFAATIAAYGAAQPAPYTACPLPPPTSFSPAFSRTCTSPRMPSQPVQQLVEPDLSQTQLFQLYQSQHELPGPHLLPTFSAEELPAFDAVPSRCSAGQDAAAGTVQHGPLPLPPAPMVAPPLPPVVEPAQTPAAVKWQPPTPMKQAHGTAYPSPSPGSGSRAAPSPAPASVDAELLQLLDWEDELDGSYRRAVVTLRNRAVSKAALLRH